MSDKEAKKVDEVKKDKKDKKEKKVKEVSKLIVKSSKANPKEKIDPRTGTRFAPGTARQVAFDLIFNAAKNGKVANEIREILKANRKENGKKFNLDQGYLNFVVASHPEFFEAYSNGEIKILKSPSPDPTAAKKLEEELTARKKKAVEARKKRIESNDDKKEANTEGKKDKKKKKKKVVVKE